MSNTVVGGIYKRVIDAVIEASRNDFEENGVSTAVLESMQEKWQNRLTSSERALFPWDPQPEPPKSERNPDRGSISSPYTNGNTSNAGDNPHIKQESYEQSYTTMPPRAQVKGPGAQYAHQRAAQLVQAQFGSQAAGSINALHNSVQRQHQQTHPSPQSQQQSLQQQQDQQQNYPPYPQQSPYGAVQNSSTIKQENVQPIKQEDPDHSKTNGVRAAQLDGTGDEPDQFDAIIARRNPRGETEAMGRIAIDQTIRDMIGKNAQRLEGGGLMVPLDESLPFQRHSRQKKNNHVRHVLTITAPSASTHGHDVPQSSQSSHVPRFGGDMADDGDEDEDEDAINSELDDPDETADTTQEGVYEGDVILCLYDKVQRVKNKWKCVLRDGILTVDGKDYIFHKATGEFEW